MNKFVDCRKRFSNFRISTFQNLKKLNRKLRLGNKAKQKLSYNFQNDFNNKIEQNCCRNKSLNVSWIGNRMSC